MGNKQSTRWKNHLKKQTVENFTVIDISSWSKQKYTWQQEIRAEIWGQCGQNSRAIIPDVCLGYGMDERIEIDIEATSGNWLCDFRYWFLCPTCARRSKKLYRPSGETLFGCRQCYNLTYTSCQTSH